MSFFKTTKQKIFLPLIFFASISFAQEKKALVTGISAYSTSANKIIVSWILPKGNADSVSSFKIYRTLKPVTDFSELEFVEPISFLSKYTENYTDSPRTNQEFFYTVVTFVSSVDSANQADFFKEENSSPVKVVLPGVNATVQGAKVNLSMTKKPSIDLPEKQKKEYPNSMREKPLPYVDIFEEDAQSKNKLSASSRQNAQSLLGKKKKSAKPKVLSPHYFEEDLVSPDGGDEYLLFEILKTSFVKKKYSESVSSLTKFLAQNRTKEVSDRASFYLAESCYYTGDFAQALTRFLSLEDVYPELSRKWVESTLDNFSL
jgi:TolA-binding protein